MRTSASASVASSERPRVIRPNFRAVQRTIDGRKATRREASVMLMHAFDSTFIDAVAQRIVRPLAARGIIVPPEDVTALTA